jgi:hypothetical protein
LEFTLYYKGVISTKNKKRIELVHELRYAFHEQLKELLKLPPLKYHKDWFKDPYPVELHKKFDTGLDFICLVSQKLNMYVELEINLLTQYKNRNFKDIDNKIKIIGDALQIPNQQSHIPNASKNIYSDNLIICLLSDDRLIYRLNVDSDYILTPDACKREEMICLIKVKIKSNRFTDKFKDLVI